VLPHLIDIAVELADGDVDDLDEMIEDIRAVGTTLREVWKPDPEARRARLVARLARINGGELPEGPIPDSPRELRAMCKGLRMLRRGGK